MDSSISRRSRDSRRSRTSRRGDEGCAIVESREIVPILYERDRGPMSLVLGSCCKSNGVYYLKTNYDGSSPTPYGVR